jgi:alpha-2-macroglobulin
VVQSKKLRVLFGAFIYLIVITATLTFAWRMEARTSQQNLQSAVSPQPSPAVRPRFSLSTNRTYGSHEKARVYVNYQGIDSLDFRVYQVKDPFKFFKQLQDSHQMGEEDRSDVSEIAATLERKPSFLEKVRSFKRSVFLKVKNYFRSQLRREARTAFNDRYRSGEQITIEAAEYAGLPVLNPGQLRYSFRQILAPLDNEYDTRMVPLRQIEPGVYIVEAVKGDLRAYTIAVVTDLTMINKTTTDGEMLLYLVDRRSGKPESGVNVQVVRKGLRLAEGATDSEGILRARIRQDATLKVQRGDEDYDPEKARDSANRDEYLILASRDRQFAVSGLSPFFFGWNDSYGGQGYLPGIASYIYTDRPIYRPNQKVYFKGILRRLGEGGYEMLDTKTVKITIADPNGGEILKKDFPMSPRGTFNGEVDISGNAPLGHYSIVVRINDAVAAQSQFEVEEYKKPEYKINVTTSKPYVPVGEKTKFKVEAKYFFGEPVQNADVQYYIYRSHYYHWWWESDEDDGIGTSPEEQDDGDESFYGYGNDMVKEGKGKLDANGVMEVEFQVPQPDPKESVDYTYRLEAQVTDSARRTIEGKASFVGTRGSIVAYASPDRYVYYQNDTARIKIRTADYEGRPVSAKVALNFVDVKYQRIEKQVDGNKYFDYRAIRTVLSSGETTTNAQGEAVYDYRVPIVGFIDIETLVEEGGKKILFEGGYVYATDRNNRWAENSYRDYSSIKLITDKKSYRPGETARVLAMLPTDKAHLLVTTEMSKVLEYRHVYSEGRAISIDLPIKSNYSPNIYLNVAYVKDGEMYSHSKNIAVPARDKFLLIEVISDKKQYKPRDPASYSIIARNTDGTPASGVEVSLGIVDEAIYSVRPDTSGDIRRAFYGTRYSRVSTNFSNSYSFTGYSGKKEMQIAGNKRSYQLADFKSDSQYAEAVIRKDFKDTAFWQPDVITGPDGKATVKFNLPDNLTTWRGTARAVSPDLRVGSRVEKVLSRKDLILRLETPRFMTEGDVVTVSGIVHNYLDADKVTNVDLEVTGATPVDQAQKRVTVTKQGEQRIDWRISASQIGDVTLVARARTDEESDGIELKVPIIPVGLKQTVGGAAALAAENAEKVFSLDLPANANTKALALRIEAAPSMAGALFGALDYLTGYPWGCTEQTISSFLPNVIVAQTLKEVKTSSIRATNDLPKKVQRGLERLYDFQLDNGGWGWWKVGDTDPFMTAYVVDGLTMARRAGFGVDSYRLDRARVRIKQLLDAGKAEKDTIDPDTRAYLIYVYTMSGDSDARYVNDLFARRSELQPYGSALLALALKARADETRASLVAGEIERAARTTDFDAHWESQRKREPDYIQELDIEATAMSLKALAQIDPKNELLPKAARWLVSNRRNGYYWDSTKNTAFAIYGLTDYLKVGNELSPDYTVEVYLNGEQVLSKRVTAADAKSVETYTVERKDALPAAANQVRFVKRGKGTLYASATLAYFTAENNIAARSTPNLTIEREYLRLVVTEDKGKSRWTVAPLSGPLQSGDLIVARLKVKGSRARYLMIEDPIPAGCEQVERVSGINLDYTEGKWSDWYNQREFRDQRTAIFVDYFDGDATFQYAMRVQIPGDFKIAPARAELMYQPTVQANTTKLGLNILDKK